MPGFGELQQFFLLHPALEGNLAHSGERPAVLLGGEAERLVGFAERRKHFAGGFSGQRRAFGGVGELRKTPNTFGKTGAQALRFGAHKGEFGFGRFEAAGRLFE